MTWKDGLHISSRDSHLWRNGRWYAREKSGGGFAECHFTLWAEESEGGGTWSGYTYERDNGWLSGCAVDFPCEGGMRAVGVQDAANIEARESESVDDVMAEPSVSSLQSQRSSKLTDYPELSQERFVHLTSRSVQMVQIKHRLGVRMANVARVRGRT